MTTQPAAGTPARHVSPKVSVRSRVSEILGYREFLGNLVRKELKVKYKNSALGFLWSLLHPLLYLAIFSLVLGVFLGSGMPDYHFYLLSGLLAWNLFSTGLSGSTASIVGNGSLVGKVYFPREILPLSAMGASLINFVLQLVVLLVAMLALRYVGHWDEGMLLFPVALLAEVLLVVGFGFLLAVVNVYFRDVEHLLELALLAWFWMTPIVYASAWVQDRLGPKLWFVFLMNPMTPVVLGFQRAFYAQVAPAQPPGPADAIPRAGINVQEVLVDAPLSWYFERLGYVIVFGVLLVWFAWWLFRRLDGRIAEEL